MNIFVMLFSIVCLSISLLGIIITRKLFNPLTVFCGLWAVIFFFSSLGLYDIKSVRNSTYLIMILGTISYIMGFLIDYKFLKYRKISISGIRNSGEIDYKPRYKLVYALMIFTLLFVIYNSKDSIRIILSGGNLDAVLKNTRVSSGEARRTIKNVISNLITGPFTFAVLPICAYNIVRKKEILLTILVMIQVLFGIVSSGGRMTLIYFMILVCVSFTFSADGKKQTEERINKVNRKHLRKLLFVGIVLFLIVSISRSGQKLYQHMYLYFSMQPVLFETWADIADARSIYGFGEATFNGFTFHILYLIKNIFGVPFPTNWEQVFNLIIETDTQWMPITNYELPANAYVSAFWFFYLDARIIGVIILSFLFGMITAHFFKGAVKYPNMKNICLYGMILFAVLDTYVRIRFAEGAFSAGMLLIGFVLMKKVKRNNMSR